MFMAFHTTAQRKPMLVAAAVSLLVIGIGLALQFG